MINKIKAEKENIDICEGELMPLNSKIQGEIFERVKPFMNYMRYHQLIKKVKYRIEIEYYLELDEGF